MYPGSNDDLIAWLVAACTAEGKLLTDVIEVAIEVAGEELGAIARLESGDRPALSCPYDVLVSERFNEWNADGSTLGFADEFVRGCRRGAHKPQKLRLIPGKTTPTTRVEMASCLLRKCSNC